MPRVVENEKSIVVTQSYLVPGLGAACFSALAGVAVFGSSWGDSTLAKWAFASLFCFVPGLLAIVLTPARTRTEFHRDTGGIIRRERGWLADGDLSLDKGQAERLRMKVTFFPAIRSRFDSDRWRTVLTLVAGGRAYSVFEAMDYPKGSAYRRWNPGPSPEQSWREFAQDLADKSGLFLEKND